MSELLRRVKSLRACAILRAPDPDLASKAMDAAIRGGFRFVEVTLNTPGAFGLIERLARDPDLLVGAGTVLSAADAARAVSAGAKLIVSPIFDPAVVSEAGRLGVLSAPGCATPTEMVLAARAGAELQKLFPAPADIPSYVESVLAPLPTLRIFPTAGVGPQNFLAILKAGAFAVGFVRSLFTPIALAAGDFAAIERTAKEIHRGLT